jgi:hypothetical protein
LCYTEIYVSLCTTFNKFTQKYERYERTGMYLGYRTAAVLLLGYSYTRRYEISKVNPINSKPTAEIKLSSETVHISLSYI